VFSAPPQVPSDWVVLATARTHPSPLPPDLFSCAGERRLRAVYLASGRATCGPHAGPRHSCALPAALIVYHGSHHGASVRAGAPNKLRARLAHRDHSSFCAGSHTPTLELKSIPNQAPTFYPPPADMPRGRAGRSIRYLRALPADQSSLARFISRASTHSISTTASNL
jgi:hypothetical protein